MRIATLTALAATAAVTLALMSPADAQRRRGYQPVQERITIIDENGRVRTKITVRPRSYLDGGTEVMPGERKFTDYAIVPTYMNGSPYANYDPAGSFRAALPRPGELPGFQQYAPF